MLRFYPNKMKKFFFRTLRFFVNGMCIAFVIWQTIGCVTKYVEKPQGARIQMKKSSEMPFPDITICGVFSKLGKAFYGFNNTYLQQYCGFR